jgi:uncharacterized DUF497 family protein
VAVAPAAVGWTGQKIVLRFDRWRSSRFDWDPAKAASNRRKHGVSFEEASQVFDDPLVLLLADLEHSEPRIVAIGASAVGRTLFVVSVEIGEDVLRIVSARRASKTERRSYEED